MYFFRERYGYNKYGIVMWREKINYVLDERDMHYGAHCFLSTCDELLKQYFTRFIELVGIAKDWLKQEKYYWIIFSSSWISLLKQNYIRVITETKGSNMTSTKHQKIKCPLSRAYKRRRGGRRGSKFILITLQSLKV